MEEIYTELTDLYFLKRERERETILVYSAFCITVSVSNLIQVVSVVIYNPRIGVTCYLVENICIKFNRCKGMTQAVSSVTWNTRYIIRVYIISKLSYDTYNDTLSYQRMKPPECYMIHDTIYILFWTISRLFWYIYLCEMICIIRDMKYMIQ